MNPVLAQRRAERSFERIYRRHAADVYRYALAVTGNQADAEDVTQTAFLNAYRAFCRGERPRAPENWLIAIAHNVCRQRFRQSARRPREVELDDAAAGDPGDEGVPSAEEIQRALSRLTFNQRSALVMRELEGRSYGEIAEALGLSRSAVETLIFRARRALREQLEGGLSCADVERAVSRQLDGDASSDERGRLRAHLRECQACAALARRRRAHRSALVRGLGAAPFPLPLSFKALLGGGGGAAAGAGASTGAGLALKAAAVVAAGAVATGAGYEGVRQLAHHSLPAKASAAKPVPAWAAAATARSAPARGQAKRQRLAPARTARPPAVAARPDAMRSAAAPRRAAPKSAATATALPRVPTPRAGAKPDDEANANDAQPAAETETAKTAGKTGSDTAAPHEQTKEGGTDEAVPASPPAQGDGKAAEGAEDNQDEGPGSPSAENQDEGEPTSEGS